MDQSKLQAAIAYFKDAVRESDEIMAECTPALQAELKKQKEYFVVALDALRTSAHSYEKCSRDKSREKER